MSIVIQDAVVAVGRTPWRENQIVLEAAGHTEAAVWPLTPFLARMEFVIPVQAKTIDLARVKTEMVDAVILSLDMSRFSTRDLAGRRCHVGIAARGV